MILIEEYLRNIIKRILHEEVDAKWYDARVIYTDRRTKKRLVGNIVRVDDGVFRVDVGGNKYVLAKESDLQIVDKNKYKKLSYD